MLIPDKYTNFYQVEDEQDKVIILILVDKNNELSYINIKLKPVINLSFNNFTNKQDNEKLKLLNKLGFEKLDKSFEITKEKAIELLTKTINLALC